MDDPDESFEIEIDLDELVEASNTPTMECGHCGEIPTEFIVEFRDLKSDDNPRLRSLCRNCATKILEWI